MMLAALFFVLFLIERYMKSGMEQIPSFYCV